ncbi:MAG: hypothetical protein AAF722_19490 [Cyanobacteria bacterium P01_C01_bin.70]
MSPTTRTPQTKQASHNRLRSIEWVVTPSGDAAITSGDTIELHVILTNQGHQGAIFDIYLDETAEPVRYWCQEPFQRLALDAQESAEVVFRIEVPLQTLPDNYDYLLILDAPEHYPEETPLQHQSRLQVLPPVQSVEQTQDPTFQIAPETTPERPAVLRPGQPLELQAIVYNRSPRVDRFYLSCPDLPETWYRIVYPEGLNGLGQVLTQDGLLLNPGAEGRIMLLLQLPSNITAGRHLPTLQLHSANNPELVLMDVTYLQVEPTFALSLALQDILSRVQQGPGRFSLMLANDSNTRRSLLLRAYENAENPLCRYGLETPTLISPPGSHQQVELTVQPTKRWQRPWWGQGRKVPFYVEVRDEFVLPVEGDRVEGELVWAPRPLWQRLLAAALIFGGLTALGLLIWWIFFRTPPRLQISQFEAEGEVFEAAQDDFIHLQWRVGPTRDIQGLQLTGKALSGNRHPAPVTYSFESGIPPELQSICTQTRRWLTCRYVPTDARAPGDYEFELTAIPKREGQAIATLTTDTTTVQPLPAPQIAHFTGELMTWQPLPSSANGASSDRAGNPESNPLAPFPWLLEGLTAPINLAQLPEQIWTLTWQIFHPQQIDTLELVGQSADKSRDLPTLSWSLAEGLPESLEPFCQVTAQAIVCQRFPAAVQAGEYVFELAATYGIDPDDPVGTVVKAATEPLVLVAPAAPKVLAFTTDRFTYDAANPAPIQLNWEIEHPARLQAVQVIGRSPDGRVGVPPQQFTFAGGIPPALKDVCQATAQQLSCQGVPLEFAQPGQYQFELAVIPTNNSGQPVETVKSELIDINGSTAAGPQVQFFHIDGANAPPKYTAELPTDGASRNIRLAWKVTGTDLKVELLPSPGTVPAEAVLTYELGPGEQSETLTLRVTDGEGRQVQRSVTIATVVPPSSPADESSTPQTTPAPPRRSSTQPVPVNLPASPRRSGPSIPPPRLPQ